jgi:hypothetical protein
MFILLRYKQWGTVPTYFRHDSHSNTLNLKIDIKIRIKQKKTYNVTFWLIRSNIVALEKEYITYSVCVCLCVCSPMYPVCNSHAPYCHLWTVRLYSVFFLLYLINGTIFAK